MNRYYEVKTQMGFEGKTAVAQMEGAPNAITLVVSKVALSKVNFEY